MNLNISCLWLVILISGSSVSWSQKMQIRGFAEVHNLPDGCAPYHLTKNSSTCSSADGLLILRQINSDLYPVIDPEFIAGNNGIVFGYDFKQCYLMVPAHINLGILFMVKSSLLLNLSLEVYQHE